MNFFNVLVSMNQKRSIGVITIFCMILSLFSGLIVYADTEKTNSCDVEVDPAKVLVERKGNNAVGLCLSWVTDSDKNNPQRKQSLLNVVKEYNYGTLRWPMGTLAMRYVWNTMDASGKFSYPLKPSTITPEYFTTNFPWASAGSNGEIKDEMNFDEFIDIIKATKTTPVIDVNVFGDLYKGSTINYENLKKTAVEQIKYAKEKGVTGAYWEIGNEAETALTDSYSKDIPKGVELYNTRFIEFSDAMKAIDSTAKIGVGLNLAANVNWQLPIIKGCKDKMDFVVTHQYGGHGYTGETTYENYRDDNKNLDIKIDTIAGYIDDLGKPYSDKLEIVVSEYSAQRGGQGWKEKGNVMYKALHSFEMLGDMLNHPKVTQTHFWITRNPWFKDKSDIINSDVKKTDANALNWDGTLTAMGMATGIMADNLFEKMIYTKSSTDKVRTYASCDEKSKALTIYLVNKEGDNNTANIVLSNFKGAKSASISTFTGINGKYDDTEYKYLETGKLKFKDNKFSAQLSPVSITVVKIPGSKGNWFTNILDGMTTSVGSFFKSIGSFFTGR